MRVQNVPVCSYGREKALRPKNKPSFEANVYAMVDNKCRGDRLCDLALEYIAGKFLKEAIEHGAILRENIAFGLTQHNPDNRAEFVLLDKTTELFKKLMQKPPKNSEETTLFVKAIKEDNATQKIEVPLEYHEFCPKTELEQIADEMDY